MKKILIYLTLLLPYNLLAAQEAKLTVVISKPMTFLSQDKKTFSVRYGELSDNSLSFIKITLPDGIEKTLARVVSASGVRYLDERQLEWWEHQGSVCLSKRDEETQQWLRCYWTLNKVN